MGGLSCALWNVSSVPSLHRWLPVPLPTRQVTNRNVIFMLSDPWGEVTVAEKCWSGGGSLLSSSEVSFCQTHFTDGKTEARGSSVT